MAIVITVTGKTDLCFIKEMTLLHDHTLESEPRLYSLLQTPISGRMAGPVELNEAQLIPSPQ